MSGIYPEARTTASDALNVYTSPAAGVGTAGLVVKSTPGRVYRSRVENVGAATFWVQFFNKSTAPVNGDTPVYRERVANGAGSTMTWEMFGLWCSQGIAVALSTTPGTLTLLASLDGVMTVSYA